MIAFDDHRGFSRTTRDFALAGATAGALAAALSRRGLLPPDPVASPALAVWGAAIAGAVVAALIRHPPGLRLALPHATLRAAVGAGAGAALGLWAAGRLAVGAVFAGWPTWAAGAAFGAAAAWLAAAGTIAAHAGPDPVWRAVRRARPGLSQPLRTTLDRVLAAYRAARRALGTEPAGRPVRRDLADVALAAVRLSETCARADDALRAAAATGLPEREALLAARAAEAEDPATRASLSEAAREVGAQQALRAHLARARARAGARLEARLAELERFGLTLSGRAAVDGARRAAQLGAARRSLREAARRLEAEGEALAELEVV